MENRHHDSFARKTFAEVVDFLQEIYNKEDTHVKQVEIIEEERLTESYYHVDIWYEEVE